MTRWKTLRSKIVVQRTQQQRAGLNGAISMPLKTEHLRPEAAEASQLPLWDLRTVGSSVELIDEPIRYFIPSLRFFSNLSFLPFLFFLLFAYLFPQTHEFVWGSLAAKLETMT